MEIEYRLTEADIIALAKYRLRQAPARRNPILVRRLAYAAGFTFLAAGSGMLSNNPVLPIIFMAEAVLSFLLYPVYFDWLLRKRVKTTYRDEKMRATLEPRTLSVTSEGIEEKSALVQAKVKWEAVDNIAVMPTFTVVSIQKVPSIIIPENQVVSGDYQSFVQACREFFERGGRC